MAGLTPVAEALAKVLEGAAPLPEEWVPIGNADGRILARALTSRRTQPPADMSSMDGYAVRAADLPATLAVAGEAAAGRPFAGSMAGGTTIRIFTGAEIPDGADAVVIQEDVSRSGGMVTFRDRPAPGQFIRRKGLDFAEGMAALAAGTRLEPRGVALAAAMNHATLPVHRRPRVAILSTGDELVEPGTEPGPGQIVSSNALALAAIVRREGGEATLLGIVPDRLDATLAAVRRARDEGHDILVTSGGASVGEHDLMRQVIAEEGAAPSFWKIAMRPGKPLMMANLSGLRLLGLPGNPVASFVCATLFLGPLMRSLAGRSDILPVEEDAELGAALAANDHRQDYLRAALAESNGQWVATPFPVQDSSMIRLLAEADALMVRAPHAPPAAKGERCRIIRLAR